MPNYFSVAFENEALTAANGDYDFFEFDAAADYPIELVACAITQITQEGDTNEDMLRVAVVRGNTTTGNGTATTPQPVGGIGTPQFSAKRISSTPATAGTAVTMAAESVNNRVGWSFGPVPEGMGIFTRGTALLCVRLMAALEADSNFSGWALIAEH